MRRGSSNLIPLHPHHFGPARRETRQYVNTVSATLSDHSADNVNPSTVSDHVPVTLQRNKCNTAADELNWKSTASAVAKLLLRGVKDSADTFDPLKSVAKGLCFILENCEVRSSIRIRCLALTGAPANESELTSDRIIGSQTQNTRRIPLRTCF